MIIDTHLHLIDRSALRYPWLAGVPALNRDFSYEEYAVEAQRVGVERAFEQALEIVDVFRLRRGEQRRLEDALRFRRVVHFPILRKSARSTRTA